MKYFGLFKIIVSLMLFLLALIAILVIVEVYTIEQASELARKGVGVLLIVLFFFLAIGAISGDSKKK